MDQDIQRAEKPRAPLWLKVVLGLSLAINLAVAGVAAGAFFRVSKGPVGGQMRDGFAYVAALDSDNRQTILRELRAQGRTERSSRRADTETLLRVLRATPFDAAQLKELVEGQSTRFQDVQNKLRTRWIDVVADMSPEERAAYAERLEEKLKRGPHKKRKPKN